MMKILLLTLVTTMGAWGQLTEPQRATLSGLVTGTDGRPLPGARVKLYSDPVPGGALVPLNREAFANETGQYRVQDVAPGTYLLVADASGYVAQVFGGKAGYFGTFRVVVLPFAAAPIAVTGSGEITGIDVRMSRASTLSGHVTTAAGAPAEGIAVHAVRWTYLGGVRKLLEQGRATTDNSGTYRIAGLAPGEYYVYAVPPLDLSRGGPPRRTRAATFSPNSLWYGEAVTVMLTEGVDAPADVRLREDRAITVSGKVTGRQLTVATVAIVEDADAPVIGVVPSQASAALPYLAVTYLQQKAEFVLEGVFPGPHRIVAFAGGFQPMNVSSILGKGQRGGRQAGEVPDPEEGSAGMVDIVTTNEDTDGIVIPLRPGGEITSKVTMDRMSYWDWAREHPEEPRLVRSLPRVTLMPEAGVGVGGTFHWSTEEAEGSKQRVSPGRFYVDVEGSDRWYYVKSIRLGNEDLTRKPFEFAGGSAELEVVLGTDGGSVGGFVKDRDGNAVRGVPVALWPLAYDFTRRDGGTLRTNSRHDGSFYFPLVAPGEYSAIAFEDLPDPGLAEYPSFVSRLAAKGAHVTVAPYSGTLATPEIVMAEEIKRTLDTLQ